MRIHAPGGPVGPLIAMGLALALAMFDEPPPVHPASTTLAVWTLTVPNDPPGLSHAAGSIDSLIAARLAAGGVRTIPVEEVRAIRMRLIDSLGGLFDSRTGKPIPAQQVLLRQALTRELCEVRGAAWWLQPELVVVKARFRGGQAHWHGVSEATGGRGGVSGLLLGTTEGTLPALSLLVVAQDSSGTVRYRGIGGLELLRHVEGGSLAALPQYSLLRDPARLQRAVTLALDSLVILGRATRP